MAGTLPETTGDASRQPRSSAFLPEHIRVVGRMTRPPERRPVHDTIDNIADWLLEWRQLSEGIASFDEFAWRLVAAGMPLIRVTLHTATLHPQFLGSTITWWRDTAETVQVMIAHEVGDAIPYEKNPVYRVCYGRETLRRRLDLPDDELDFAVLIELRERGGTDYIAMPIDSAYAAAYMLTFVTDRPRGFRDKQRLAALDFRFRVGAFPTQACQYCASAIAEVDRQPDELAGSGNEFHSFDQSSTDVDLLEMLHRNFGFDWSGNETGHGLCSIEIDRYRPRFRSYEEL